MTAPKLDMAEQSVAEIVLLGLPIQSGTQLRGCSMGPSALRTAGLAEALAEQGHTVEDAGDVTIAPQPDRTQEVAAWAKAADAKAYEISQGDRFPIFMGGDHSMALGTINAMARRARDQERDLIVLWLDAHSDYNTPETTPSGNIHGMPVAGLCGEPGMDFIFDGMDRVGVMPADFHLFGIRSVDRMERQLLSRRGVSVMDMRLIDEKGVSYLIGGLLEEVELRGAMLHVSLDVDFLDPSIAPAVGTTVPGGATYREAHLIMEMLSDSELVTSMDLAELNPFLDERGKTSLLLVDLVTSLFGKKIIDRAPQDVNRMQGPDWNSGV